MKQCKTLRLSILVTDMKVNPDLIVYIEKGDIAIPIILNSTLIQESMVCRLPPADAATNDYDLPFSITLFKDSHFVLNRI